MTGKPISDAMPAGTTSGTPQVLLIVTSNLPFEHWTSVLGSERLTGALLDRLTHHVGILKMHGDSYRLKQSAGRRRAAARTEQNQANPPPLQTPAKSHNPDRLC